MSEVLYATIECDKPELLSAALIGGLEGCRVTNVRFTRDFAASRWNFRITIDNVKGKPEEAP